jgi:hypothetical protein
MFESDKQYDLCIVGAGMMSLVLLKELADTDLQICVIDIGDDQSRDMHHTNIITTGSVKVSAKSRRFGLGGSARVWGGLSGVLGATDMAEQPMTDFNGWPLSPEDLIPYLVRAGQDHPFPAYTHFITKGIDNSNADLQTETFAAKTSSVQFPRGYGGLFNSDNVTLLSSSKAKRYVINGENEVDYLSVVNQDGSELKVNAKQHALASGGIENARLLLSSLKSNNFNFGWESVVGSGFYDHPKGLLCECKKFDLKKINNFLEKSYGSEKSYLGIALSEDIRKQDKLLHPYVRFQPEFGWDNNDTFLKLMDVRNRFTRKARRAPQITVFSSKTYDHILGFVLFAWFHLLKIFGVKPSFSKIKMYAHMDMRPLKSNKIYLSDKEDNFGCEIPKIDLSIGDLEVESLFRLYQAVRVYFKEEDIALFPDLTKLEIATYISHEASHHMGATRMGTNPASSVVDSKSRVHGINNLSVLGTSVMPSGGNVNPTYTAAALTIRFADHLKQNML